MQGLMGLLSIFDTSRSGTPFGAAGIANGAVPILIVLAVIGASYINSLCGRTRYLDSAVSVSGMLIGGFLANSLFGHVRLPFDNDTLVAAIVGLVGMTVTGLMLVYAYKRSDY